ncbi:SAV_2336 N-terminal domain-related protein [Streptomyces pseudogriseolus]|uniref:SAV_2336 N-terminal domain-related protein n=1 Tax=Streptomyces pseudogriseolus TaxID=36817 RepID=UPI003FA2EA7F
MPSEHRRTPLVRLADVLAEAGGGVRPTSLELAELLWLARHMEERPALRKPDPEPEPRPLRSPPQTAPDDFTPSESEPPHPVPSPVPKDPPPSARAPLHLPTPRRPAPARTAVTEPHAALLAPAPPMLRHPLALQRSLRPLKRRAAAPDRLELDERATADRIARLDAEPEWWLPVLRPAQERWLSLNLLYDTGPTMPVWRPLVRELHTALAQSGIFRTVTAHRVDPDGTVHRSAVHAPADGRTVTLLISDCMGPQWRPGAAGALWYTTLRRWARRMPLAVVQPLPEHLWRDTALPASPGLLSAPHPAAPNSALSFVPYEETGAGAGMPLLVLEPDQRWLANWAALVAAPGGQNFPGSVGWLGGHADTTDRADFATLSAEELVLRFRASASAAAVRLAGHLALGRPDLPVMRLVQAVLEPQPRPQHLAEVILSGMLTQVPGPPGSYTFRPGVRELLLRSLPRTARRSTSDFLSRLGALIDDRAGTAAGEIRATTPSAAGTLTQTRSEPIATVTEETRNRLTGRPERGRLLKNRYVLGEAVGRSGVLWRGEDVETGATVVVSLFPAHSDPARVQDFVRDAEGLRTARPPNVVRVHDYGVDDRHQYVVMENVDGIALESLLWSGSLRLPAPLLVSTVTQLARAVAAMHEAGVPHGGLDTNRVMLLPDGEVRLTLLDLGRRGEGPFRTDLRTLGHLVFRLVSSSYPVTRHALSPDQLDGLPEAVRPAYAQALRLLMSDVLEDQREGLHELRSDAHVHHARTAHAPVSYSLLGRVSARRGSEHPLATGSPQEQAMLAMLLLHHGRKVSHAELAEGIWGPEGPAGDPELLLRTYASRLRNALGPGLLAALSDGYALHTSADFVDVLTCQKLVEQVERQRVAGDLTSARTTVDEVLSLWHGEVLDGVPGPAAATARSRFQQLRLTLAATRAELDLELGAFERATTDLEDLLRTHPHREDLRRLHLLALQRQGRADRALEEFEAYEDSGGDNPELLAMGHELRDAFRDERPDLSLEEPAYEEDPPLLGGDEPDRLLIEAVADVDPPETEQHDCARFEFTEGRPPSMAMAALLRMVRDLAAAGGLARDQYQLVRFGWGVTARMEPYVDGAPLLRATLHGLAEHQPAFKDLGLAVSFWQARVRGDSEVSGDRPDSELVRAVLSASDARTVVALSDFWHDVEIVDGEAADPRDFHRFPGGGGWYLLFGPVAGVPMPAEGRAVRGPFRLPYDGETPRPVDDDHVVVLALDEGRLEAADAPSVRQTPPSLRAGWRWFEVDLRERRLHGVGVPAVSVSWRVEDPLAAARNPGLDLPALVEDVLATAARREDDLRATLADWRVPGYALLWSLSRPPGRAEIRSGMARSTPQELMRHAYAVLLGFDEVLARLYPEDEEREVLRKVAGMLLEERNSVQAPTGHPLPSRGPGDGADTLSLLRSFAGHDLAFTACNEVDAHDTRAAQRARPAPHSRELLRELAARRVPLTVVSDRSGRAVELFLRHNQLIEHVHEPVYGRSADLFEMMPRPGLLLKALGNLEAPASECVLIASTTAEQEAARAIGLPFIGYAPTNTTRRHLRAANGDVRLISSLAPLVDAVRSR